MRYFRATISEFAKYVKQNDLKIVLFGNGAVCKTFIPYIAYKWKLSDRIRFIIDNNPSKQGGRVFINGDQIPVVGSDTLESLSKDYCILITNGDFYSVVSQLDGISGCENMPCFIAAYMQLDREYDRKLHSVYKDNDVPQIPKIIHYCWFSGNPMPDDLVKCVETWEELCPDYEIIRWDESNYDVQKNRYTREAHAMKKWGYIPDIVRLEKLYECGGFYFDTDVRMIRNPEPLRYETAFCGRERAGHINFGGGSGCVKGAPVIKKILDFRIDEPFDLGDGKFNSEASGYYESTPLMELGLEIEDRNQKLEGINIYASEFFSPYNYINGENIQNDNTFSIHCFNGSWIGDGNQMRKETREKYQEFKLKMEKITK